MKHKATAMSRICALTGKKALVGNRVSHAHNKTKRRFEVNLIKKRFYLPEEGRWIRIRVSAQGLRIVDKLGITETVKRARDKGYMK